MNRHRVTIASSLILVAILGLTSGVPSAGASSKSDKLLECQASRIEIKLGPDRKITGSYGLVSQLVPVFFKNMGSACHLSLGAPNVRAVRDLTNGRVTKDSVEAFPASVPSGAKVNLQKGETAEALFEIVKSIDNKSGCDPMAASGLVVQGYAEPVGSRRVLVRAMPGVCFDTGVGVNVTNTGIIWQETKR